jgi:hypothetical protein
VLQLSSVRLQSLVALAIVTLSVCRTSAAERPLPRRVRVVADDVHLRSSPDAREEDNIARHVSPREEWNVEDSAPGPDEYGRSRTWYRVINDASLDTGWIAEWVTMEIPVRDAAAPDDGATWRDVTTAVVLGIGLLTALFTFFTTRTDLRAKRMELETQRLSSERLRSQQATGEVEPRPPQEKSPNVAEFRRPSSNVRERLGIPERNGFRNQRSG